ncbi:MAG TPA: IclR family transcriptional regulator [Trebonia sp.]|nr:IclR family transcriptional regulator [Trebonia sp.]
MPATAPGPGYRERNSTADRTLDILAMFDQSSPTVSIAQVVAALGVSRSTAYRYMQSLVQARFLEESGAGEFRLGSRVLELAYIARRGLDLSELARPVMHQLAAETGETVLLNRWAGTSVICLEREDVTGRTIRISYERGQVFPGHAGAAAYVLLGGRSPEQLDELLARLDLRSFTPETVTSADALRTRVAEAERLGYAVSRGELDRDVLGIAAPVRSDGEVVASLGIAAISSQVPDQRARELCAAVVSAAGRLSASLALLR